MEKGKEEKGGIQEKVRDGREKKGRKGRKGKRNR